MYFRHSANYVYLSWHVFYKVLKDSRQKIVEMNL